MHIVREYNMFGYIKPFIPSLRVYEHELYKAVYCGVCHALGESYGAAARMTLSYDFTFAAMLYASLNEDTYEVEKTACPFNPLKKRAALKKCEASYFSCDAAMILLWCKNIDNVEDSSFGKKMLYRGFLPFTKRCAQKAKVRDEDLFEAIEGLPSLQEEAEGKEDFTLDSVCDPTAVTLSKIFSLMSEDENNKRILSRLGYMLGRFIYICDAVDDFDKDMRKGSFNPFGKELDMGRASMLLNHSISEACLAYELLPKGEFSPILDNIMFEGLNFEAKELLNRRIKNDRSL